MVHVAAAGGFLSGLALGLVAGILLAPVLRFWLAWREWDRASREARLTESAMKRMGDGPWRLLRSGSTVGPHRPASRPGAP